jgi:hypothetical protein
MLLLLRRIQTQVTLQFYKVLILLRIQASQILKVLILLKTPTLQMHKILLMRLLFMQMLLLIMPIPQLQHLVEQLLEH